MAKMDVIGKRFGRLTVLSRKGEDRPLRYQVVCSCDCGKEWAGYLYSLTTGYTKSCGCLNIELTKKRTRGERHHVDLTGKRFGRLEVISRAGTTSNRGAKWLCRCDCGKEKEVPAHSMVSMGVISCGCVQKEKAKALMTKHGRYKDADYIQELDMKRRAILMDAYVETVNPAIVYERDMGLCHLCGLPVEAGEFHLDHRTALINGGKHSYENCYTSHAICNTRKGRKQMSECAHLWAR